MIEHILEDSYPLYPGYLYVVGDKVFQNYPGFKTVKEMRDALVSSGCEEPGVAIKNCDIVTRGLSHLAV